MSEQTLVEIVQALEPQLLASLSSIKVAYTDGAATATLSFALYRPIQDERDGAAQLPGGYAVTVDDTTPLPPGVSAGGMVRWPDRVAPLSMREPVEQQIRALHASGLVGRLDAARFDGGAAAVHAGIPPTSWIIKTHAGSKAERAEWSVGLAGKRGPGRPREHHDPRQDVRVSLPVDLIAAIDAAAGPGQRTSWIERAIRAALAQPQPPAE